MSKGLKITLGIISILLVLIIIALGVYYLWPWNKKFFDNSNQEFEIPGLDDNFVPQGFTKIDGYNKYLISGYMSDGTPSRFYVIDGESKKVDNYFILEINGSKKYTGHAGGVVSYGSTLWTVSKEEDKGYAFMFYLSDIMNLKESGSAIMVRNYFDTYNNADYAFIQNDTLWIGEFYKEGKYETDTDHHLKTRSGEMNKSVVYGYKIDESYQYRISSLKNNKPYPAMALSTRDLVQGIAITEEGKFVLSTSWSIADSNIYYYENVFSQEAHDKLKVGLVDIPLWYLDNDALISTTNAPAMTEEIIIENDRVYILFESACNKYKLFNRKRLTNVYSIPVSYLSK